MKPSKQINIVANTSVPLEEIVFIPTTSDWVRIYSGLTLVSGSQVYKNSFTTNGFRDGAGFLPLEAVVSDYNYEFRIYPRASNSSRAAMAGMIETYTTPFPTYNDLTHGIYQTATNAYIREGAVSVFTIGGGMSSANKFNIIRTGNTVRYYKNDVLIYTSLTTTINPVTPNTYLNKAVGVSNNKLTYLG